MMVFVMVSVHATHMGFDACHQNGPQRLQELALAWIALFSARPMEGCQFLLISSSYGSPTRPLKCCFWKRWRTTSNKLVGSKAFQQVGEGIDINNPTLGLQKF